MLERSSDHGATFQPWQYFANSNSDCHNLFGIDAFEEITSDNSVICTSEYSDVVPLESGEVSLVCGWCITAFACAINRVKTCDVNSGYRFHDQSSSWSEKFLSLPCFARMEQSHRHPATSSAHQDSSWAFDGSAKARPYSDETGEYQSSFYLV